jgi:tetratricopeptide (TPR) repeat protein
MSAPRVFLSYSHDSSQHKADVLALARRLQDDGCAVVIDHDELFPPKGWTVWMQEQIEQADFVLVICTEAYRRRAEGKEDPPHGAGASWEGAIIRLELYQSNGRNDRRFIPVVMHAEDRDHRPKFIQDYSYFVACDREDYRKLCKILGLGDSPPEAVPLVWHIPPPNPLFTGREEYLRDLRKAFVTGTQPVALTQAIKGLGGMGKTQTALKYAELHRCTYTAGLRVVADSRDKLISGYAEFARLLSLPGKDDPDIAVAARSALRWFDANADWLLILDNVDDWDVIRPWMPTSKRGHVLITTRLQFTGTFAAGLDLPKFAVDEGASFLLARGKLDRPTASDQQAARNIVVEFGGLPLGLEQAGAYIEEAQLSPAEYLELYRSEGRKLRDRGGQSADHDTVSVTFSLAFARLSESAKRIVQAAAFLAPDAIPEELLATTQPPGIEFRDAVTDAVRYSLIQRIPPTKMFDVHRLVQAVVRDGMEDAEKRGWIAENIQALNRRFPEVVEFRNWPACERLLPHALATTSRVSELLASTAESAQLLHQTGWYLLQRAKYLEAESLVKSAITMRETVLGPEHPDYASSLNDLGWLYVERGRYADARPLLTRALSIRENALGPEHPDTLTSINNVAGLSDSEGNFDHAEVLYSRAITVRERVSGPEHPDTAILLGNLGNLYRAQKRYAEAEQLLRRALAIREEALGVEHPDTANSLNQLGILYSAQHRFHESELLFRRALEIQEKVLGPEHPGTAWSLHNLAELCVHEDRYSEAESFFRRSLEIRQKVHGTQAPRLAADMSRLAHVYFAKSHYREAEGLLRRVLDIREKVLGPCDRATAITLYDLGVLCAKEGRSAESQQLLRRALDIEERTLGPEHLETAKTLNQLAVTCVQLQHFPSAETYCKRALSAYEKQLGTKHTDTIAIARMYLQVLQQLGWHRAAQKLRARFGI